MTRIGVLGGIGPEASAAFYSRLIRRLQESGLIKSNRDFPHIIINSIPAPELTATNISDEDIKPYLRGIKELDQFKVDFIVMVCNTIHLYHELLQKHSHARILDLRQELKLMLQGKGSALMLGTPSSVKQGLYKMDGIRLYEPNQKELAELSKAIVNYNSGVNKLRQIRVARNICRKYLRSGAETVILGCTEFALMLANEDFQKIDTIDVLVEATMHMINRGCNK